MRKQKTTSRAVAFGGPTVLTVLIVLCFACLSVLALSRARRDETLAVRAAETVAAYYQAEGAAETVLSGLNDLCAASPARAGEAMADAARQMGAEAAFDAQEGLLSFSFDAGAQGRYTVSVRLSPADGGTAWTLTGAHIMPDDPAETEQTLPVYQ